MVLTHKQLQKQKMNRTRHDFLLTLFPQTTEPLSYTTYPLNGFILVRQWNKSNASWEVAIFRPDDYLKSRSHYNQNSRKSE